MSEPLHRYAIYYAPATDSPWWRTGSQWLGRCAATGRARRQPLLPGISAETFSVLTAAPRRYGWHATLKAPFSLAEGTSLNQLCTVIENLAGALSTFDMPALRVQRLDDFLALVPNSGAVHLLEGVARVCVQELAPLSAPLSDADLQRRRQAPLTAAQDALLLRWGYPYVMEEFRFHCSLTGSLNGLDSAQMLALQRAAEATFHQLPTSQFQSLALFEEPAYGSDFRLVQHFGLRA